MSYEVMDEEVPKSLWCQMETLTLPLPALTVIISSPKPLTEQHSLTNLLSFFKRKWETSLKQPQKSPALLSQADCSNFTWLSLCGPQAPAQELVLEQEAQKNSCRREIPVNQSQYKPPAFNSQGKNLASQSSHPTKLFHTTDASPPQLVLSLIWSYLSGGKGRIMWVKRTPWDSTVSPEERRLDWVTGQSTHLTSFQDGVILIKRSQSQPPPQGLWRDQGGYKTLYFNSESHP